MKASKSPKFYFFIVLTFFIGMAMNIQSGVNGQLRTITANPVLASTVNFTVGALTLLLLLWITGKAGIYQLPQPSQLRETRWWMWMGGPMGVIYVMSGVLIPPMIGFGAFFSMVVAGQLLFSAAIDQMGWFGNRIVKMDKRKLVGILLLLIGAVLIQNT